ncbi:MAG: helix-turn-helix transcriptional regulator [Deferribacteraceae bacterium]|jgi:transcriptional regulator with XRE-family HTH domain|nr:helix-turn-helix transcriptional regulator [Deferribacteraceae bacterium]
MTYSDLIAKRILDLCNERNITLNRLATLSGINHSTLENIVKKHNKNMKLRTICRIATGFGISPAQFLDFPEMTETVVEDE